jgi:hypothetical protein
VDVAQRQTITSYGRIIQGKRQIGTSIEHIGVFELHAYCFLYLNPCRVQFTIGREHETRLLFVKVDKDVEFVGTGKFFGVFHRFPPWRNILHTSGVPTFACLENGGCHFPPVAGLVRFA